MPTVYTSGFLNSRLQARHFQKHVLEKNEFGVLTEEEYLENADRFVGEPLDANTQVYYRKYGAEAGDMVRYNSVTNEYGVLSKDGFIITYFIADYSFGTNQEYFELEKTKDEAKR